MGAAMSPLGSESVLDFQVEISASPGDIQVDAHIARSERRPIRSLVDVEDDHRGLIALPFEEEDVGLVGSQLDVIWNAVEGHLVEVDCDVLRNTIESNRLFVRASAGGQQRKDDCAASKRPFLESQHGCSVALRFGIRGLRSRSLGKLPWDSKFTVGTQQRAKQLSETRRRIQPEFVSAEKNF